MNNYFVRTNSTRYCYAYDTEELKKVPYVTAAATENENGEITVFAMNRSLEEAAEIDGIGFDGMKLASHTVLNCDDMKAVNSFEDPEHIAPAELPVGAQIVLPAHSWNVLRFTKA